MSLRSGHDVDRAHRGARSTGVDFSPKAIELARTIAQDSELDATFVCSDVLELPDNLDGKFDIVYTSFGVLAWLSDLDRWARVVDQFLVPGGTFYIAEYHPITYVFDDQNENEPLVKHPYFPRSEPIEFRIGGQTEYGWPYSMGSVVSALAGVGLDRVPARVRLLGVAESAFPPARRSRKMETPRDAGGRAPAVVLDRAKKDNWTA